MNVQVQCRSCQLSTVVPFTYAVFVAFPHCPVISDHRFLGFLVPWNRNEWIQERILCRVKQSLSHPLKERTLVIRFMGRYVRKSLGRLEVLNNLET